MKEALTVRNVFFRYSKAHVLKEISFSVLSGQFFIVIGPNGSGKTTLMKVLSGIMEPVKGEIEVLGRPVREYRRRELARHVAYVPQMTATDFPFTVRELVLMGRSPYLGILGVEGKHDLEAAEKAMGYTGVDHLADRRLSSLSGGEQQRVFIARAVCQEPDIVLLDEPTASLDLAHQIRVMDLMARLSREKGICVCMVLHDINLASMYADRLLLLSGGETVSMGTPGDVLTRERLAGIYGCDLLLDQSPVGHFPRITLKPGRGPG